MCNTEIFLKGLKQQKCPDLLSRICYDGICLIRKRIAKYWTSSHKKLGFSVYENTIREAINGSGDYKCALIRVVFERVLEVKGIYKNLFQIVKSMVR